MVWLQELMITVGVLRLIMIVASWIGGWRRVAQARRDGARPCTR